MNIELVLPDGMQVTVNQKYDLRSIRTVSGRKLFSLEAGTITIEMECSLCE